MGNKIDVRRFKPNNLNTREVNIGAVGNASLCLLTLVTLTENNFWTYCLALSIVQWFGLIKRPRSGDSHFFFVKQFLAWKTFEVFLISFYIIKLKPQIH